MVREGRGSRISRPIMGRMWASSSRTTSRSAVMVWVVMVRCSFRSIPLLVVVASRRFRSPAYAAARVVAERLVRRAARAATHDLGYVLRGGVPRLDPRPLTDVEDLRQATDALGEVQSSPSVIEDSRAGGGVGPRGRSPVRLLYLRK